MKQKRIKRFLALTLALSLMLTMFLPVGAYAEETYDFWDLRNTDNITTTVYSGTIDGEPATITMYTGWYAADHNNTKQQVRIYVPSNAGPYSAILHAVNNSGWNSNNFPGAAVSQNFNYNLSTASNANLMQQAFVRGMIYIHNGARSRNDSATDGLYLGHSPATMTDTKAALRFLRYNCEPGRLLYGLCNPDMAFVSGTSGGGALSVILAASGNSPDYYESLYEIGAAGVEKAGDSYYSTISDAYIGTVAYCPITDLPMADQAYEFTYNASRSLRANNANVNGNKAPLESNYVMQASNWLAGDFAAYINGLGLRDEYGVPLTASFEGPAAGELSGITGGTFKDAMQRLLEKGIDKAIDEHNSGYTSRSNADPVNNFDTYTSWLLINGGAPTAGIPAPGAKATIYDLDQFLTTIPNSALKIAPAFDNLGLVHAGSQNENDLVGTDAQRYSHWHEYAWNDANTSIAGVGLTDTGLIWDEFLQTADGALVALQAKMTTPIPYLLGTANIPYLKYTQGSDVCDVAPYWYVRHGQADRDTSFSVGTLLYYSLLSNNAVDQNLLNLNFAWRKTHSGGYDTGEALDWVDAVLADAAAKVVSVNVDDVFVTKLSGNKNDLTIIVTETFLNAAPITYMETISINNNAADTYQVGPYRVYVDTKGNDQIRACYIV